MRLLDPSRPHIQSRPAFLMGSTVIPHLSIFPTKADDIIEVSAMLPVQGEGPFVSKLFATAVRIEKIPDLLRQFSDDPETTITSLFGADPSGFIPAISTEPEIRSWARDIKKARESRERPAPKVSTLFFEDEGIDGKF